MGNNKGIIVLCAFILSLGILGAGYSVAKGAYLIRLMNRTVIVKGLAEQDVQSDLGLWEINYREIGNDLLQLDQRLQHDQETVVNFLKQQGFTLEEVSTTQIKVEDRLANVYNQSSTQTTAPRYVVTGGVRIRSEKVALIQKALQIADQLLQQGIPLAFDVSGLSPNPSFIFTQLDAIRPQMLAQATKSAHTVASQFAQDSGSELNGIQRATQGMFEVRDRDISSYGSSGAINKKVRLVTTIEYRLR